MGKLRIFAVIFILCSGLASAMPPRPNAEGENFDLSKKPSSPGTESSVYSRSLAVQSFPLTGNDVKVLVLVAGFKDTDLDPGATEEFYDELFNGSTSKPMSLRKYYQDMSGGKLNLDFDVFVVGNVSNNRQHYGENTSSEGQDAHPEEFVAEAIDLGDSAGIDYSLYDNDGNGFVDAVIVIHQGQGEEASGSEGTDSYNIWSHRWTLSSANFYNRNSEGYSDIANDTDDDGILDYDGVKINDYDIQPEYVYDPGDSTIGVFAHEFGHILGLPDLYDTHNPPAADGIGNWGLMSGGAWLGPNGLGSVPAPMTAWSRMSLGWLSVSNQTAGITASPSETNRRRISWFLLFILIITAAWKLGKKLYPQTAAVISALLIMTLGLARCGKKEQIFSLALADVETSYKTEQIGINLTEYLLLENKVKTNGTWSEYIPGAGLLIYHIDTDIINNRFYSNSINDYTIDGKIGVRIIEADGEDNLLDDEDGDEGSPTDPFYYGNVNDLTGITANSGESAGIEITNVGSIGAVIPFTVFKK